MISRLIKHVAEGGNSGVGVVFTPCNDFDFRGAFGKFNENQVGAVA
jgi:hypothetical protein